MDAFDRQLVSFLLDWAPFGGPPEEDAFCEFGLTLPRMYERMSEIIASGLSRATTLSDSDRRLLTLAWDQQLHNRSRPAAHAVAEDLGGLPRAGCEPAVSTMDTVDRSVLQYVLAWAKFDGPPEDEVLREFGKTTLSLHQAFVAAVMRGCECEHALSAGDRVLLRRAKHYLGLQRPLR